MNLRISAPELRALVRVTFGEDWSRARVRFNIHNGLLGVRFYDAPTDRTAVLTGAPYELRPGLAEVGVLDLLGALPAGPGVVTLTAVDEVLSVWDEQDGRLLATFNCTPLLRGGFNYAEVLP